MSEAVIQLVDVVKSFKSQVVLDRVNLEISTGRTTVIAGQSGQGKSVTLKLILGLMRPDSGQVLVNGRDISRMRKRQLDEVRTNFGVLFQGGALFDSLSVFENVALPLRERTKSSRQEIRERVMETLALFDLTGHEDKYPAQISGGMKKRVGLARALQLEPRIMLFDEPTTGLDPTKSMEIYQLFHRAQERFGYTSIIVSHDIPKIFNLADQVVILQDGRMHRFNNPEDIHWSDDPGIMDFVRLTMGQIYQSEQMER
ncbi:MAG: ABC transporter ATP-binding protein [Deltaproteobacteria bacterium RIFOXYD12_FULL_57_12]|nr:MAG: ABC transporter ATP-binding protein [Deltaproteobacteria bacterium RIFOXYD12_FULL_57_12]